MRYKNKTTGDIINEIEFDSFMSDAISFWNLIAHTSLPAAILLIIKRTLSEWEEIDD